jgi:hypothetical protein
MIGRNAATDASSLEGAGEIARRIERWWLDRGYRIETRVIRIAVPNEAESRHPVHGVRSNLVNGLPPPSCRHHDAGR